MFGYLKKYFFFTIVLIPYSSLIYQEVGRRELRIPYDITEKGKHLHGFKNVNLAIFTLPILKRITD